MGVVDISVIGGVVALLLTVVGYFLKGVIGDLHEMRDDLADVDKRLALMERNADTLDALGKDMAKVREDMVWVRERIRHLQPPTQ